MSILTIGEILVEMVAEERNQKFSESGIYHGPFPSGAPAIFIDQAALCGSKTKIISSVGKDGFGEININRLTNSGVDTQGIRIDENKTTGTAFVTYQDDGDRDFIFHLADSASGDITKEQVDKSYFNDVNYLHIMGSSVYNKEIQDAISKGIEFLPEDAKISFDPNIRKEILNDTLKLTFLKEVLKKSDIVLASVEELSYLLDLREEHQIVEMLKNQYNLDILVLKDGKNGSKVFHNGNIFNIKPYSVTEVDPTGAGDCYAGTFISLINQGYEPEEAALRASAAGAMAVTKRGPMEGNSTVPEIEEFIKKQD